MRLCLFPLVPLLVSSTALAQAPLASWYGNPGDGLGTLTRSVGDFDGDGRADFAASSAASIRVYSSATLALLREFPSTVAEAHAIKDFDFADCDGDGTLDLIAGFPESSSIFTHNGCARVFSGRTGQVLIVLQGTQILEQLGQSILALGDLSGDGRADFAVSSPGWGSQRGRVQFVSGADGTILATRTGATPSARMGQVMEWVGDVNGDSREDLGIASNTYSAALNGIMNQIEVLSLPDLTSLYSMPSSQFTSFQCVGELNGDGIPDLALIPPPPGYFAASLYVCRFGGSAVSEQYGTAMTLDPNTVPVVTRSADLDGDGVANEFLVGVGPNYTSQPGRVFVCRGANVVRTIHDAGGTMDNAFGSALAMLGDLDGNASAEALVGAPLERPSPSSYQRSGRVVILSAYTPAPVEYCTAKTNGLGCVPQLSFSGVASLSGTEVLSIAASNVLNRRTGLCLWGTQRQEVPFAGGYLCVAPPFQRGPATNAGGSASGDDCSGRLEFSPLPLEMWLRGVEIGDLVRLQFWQRDPLNVDGTGASLSAGIEARVGW